MAHPSKAKGNRWENAVARIFREALGDETIRRGFQARGGGREVADVVVQGLHLECKHEARCDWRAAYRQAVRDVEARTWPDGAPWPVAVCKDHGNPPPSPFVVVSQEMAADWPSGLTVATTALVGVRADVRQGLRDALQRKAGHQTLLGVRAEDTADVAVCVAPLDKTHVLLLTLEDFITLWRSMCLTTQS